MITVDKEYLEFNSGVESDNIHITTSMGVGFTASTTDTWIEIANGEGIEMGYVGVSVGANPLYTPRTGTILVQSSEGDELTISVSQAKKALILPIANKYYGSNLIKKIWKNNNVIYQRVYIPDKLDIEPLSVNISNMMSANVTVNATKPYTISPEVIIYPGTSEYGVSVNYTINGNTVNFTPAFNYTGTTGIDTYADFVMGDITQRLSIKINPPMRFVTDIYVDSASFDINANLNTLVIPDVDMVCALEYEPILAGCDRYMGFSWEDMTGIDADDKDFRVFTPNTFDWNSSRMYYGEATGNTDIWRVIFGNNTAGWGVISGRKNNDTWNFQTTNSTKPASLLTTDQPVRIDLSAIKVRKATIWKKINGVDTNLFNGVPAINGNGVAGLFDDVSGNFFTNSNYTILYDE